MGKGKHSAGSAPMYKGQTRLFDSRHSCCSRTDLSIHIFFAGLDFSLVHADHDDRRRQSVSDPCIPGEPRHRRRGPSKRRRSQRPECSICTQQREFQAFDRPTTNPSASPRCHPRRRERTWLPSHHTPKQHLSRQRLTHGPTAQYRLPRQRDDPPRRLRLVRLPCPSKRPGKPLQH
ncbi:hypothetical protein BJY04DRAFT_200432 [Aspergillus karnatakaensis]|uniref:uncharacterized protein n=1 Tax=Aspergillus karnatakaensis TaxID=1810916 RepID=UPI003CCE2203